MIGMGRMKFKTLYEIKFKDYLKKDDWTIKNFVDKIKEYGFKLFDKKKIEKLLSVDPDWISDHWNEIEKELKKQGIRVGI